MKVRELMALLQHEDQEATVRTSQPSHDHWHTEIAAEIRSVSEAGMKRSEYHAAWAVSEDDCTETCVLLSETR